MTKREDILRQAAMRCKKGEHPPIYSILLFQHPDKEHVYKMDDGKEKLSGFPDMGCSAEMGYFYNLDDAIQSMNENALDIQECVYLAGFILCQFEGLYQSVGSESRMYFVWDEEKNGFFQQEEPAIFSHMAY